MQKLNPTTAIPKLELQKSTLRPLTDVELWATVGAGGESPVLERNKRIME